MKGQERTNSCLSSKIQVRPTVLFESEAPNSSQRTSGLPWPPFLLRPVFMDTKIAPPHIQLNLAVYSKAFLKEQKSFSFVFIIPLYLSASETDTDFKKFKKKFFFRAILKLRPRRKANSVINSREVAFSLSLLCSSRRKLHFLVLASARKREKEAHTHSFAFNFMNLQQALMMGVVVLRLVPQPPPGNFLERHPPPTPPHPIATVLAPSVSCACPSLTPLS